MRNRNFRAPIGKVRTIPRRIDKSLDEIVQDIAKKNEISFRQATAEMAKMFKIKVHGNKLMEEIRF